MSPDIIVGTIAGIFTGISMLPQLVKMIQERKATDISKVMLATLMLGLCLWVCYGIMKKDWPLIITNSFSIMVNILILILRAHFKNKGR